MSSIIRFFLFLKFFGNTYFHQQPAVRYDCIIRSSLKNNIRNSLSEQNTFKTLNKHNI